MKPCYIRGLVIIVTSCLLLNKDYLIHLFKIGMQDLTTPQEQCFIGHLLLFSFNRILINNVSKYLTALSKLRMSSQRLEVEAGRWLKPNRIPLDEIKCFFLEDEFHFVLECSVYAELREKYISK